MDYLFTNGFVFNTHKHALEEQSLLVSQDRISCIGSLDECKLAAKNAFETIDLQRRLLLPAFTDAHTHFVEYAKSRILVDLSQCASLDAMESYLIAYRDNLQWDTDWILGGSWDKNRLSEPRLLNRQFLDRIFPDKPVALMSKDYHSILLNSLALALAGINRHSPNPAGGLIERDSQGEATGVLSETAINLVLPKMVQAPDSEVVKAIIASVKDIYRVGLIGFHSMESSHSRDLMLQAQSAGTKFRLCWHFMLEDYEEAQREYRRSYESNEWFKPGGLKLFGDGSLGSQTAAMFEPYADGQKGILRHPASEMLALMQDAAEHGFASTVHAIGNRCVAQVIDCALQLKDLSQKHQLRQRIEHVQSIRAEDIPRLKESGLLASVQPLHLANDVPMIEKHWNSIQDEIYSFNSMLQNQIPLAFGSDAPIESINPFLGIHSAVYRQSAFDKKTFRPEEAIYPLQAISAYSWGSALASCSEQQRGSLDTGKLADLIVIDDFRHQPADFWLTARSHLTMLNGEIVWAEQ